MCSSFPLRTNCSQETLAESWAGESLIFRLVAVRFQQNYWHHRLPSRVRVQINAIYVHHTTEVKACLFQIRNGT
jgi:hypothetical protein